MEGTFFNDVRVAGASDLSIPIRHFCAHYSIAAPEVPDSWATGDYSTVDMASATFQDLWLRAGAGAGYVYYHQVRLCPEPCNTTILSSLAMRLHDGWLKDFVIQLTFRPPANHG